jgi:hypothetical protein
VKGALGRIAVPFAVLMSLWAASAFAQLYRWVDPETGSVKFSSYPPPWFNDPARQPRAPKVETIAPTRTAPAFEPRPESPREPAAPPTGDAPRSDRQGLLKLLSQRVAALALAPPDMMGKTTGELLELLQQLEKLDRQSKPADAKDEATRLEERWQLAVPLERHRTTLLQQIASASPPPPGSAPDKVDSAWAGTQRLLAALGWVDSAIVGIDPRNANARHFEMNALIDTLVAKWEPYVDPSVLRKNRGR